jgi:hypothetical protein
MTPFMALLAVIGLCQPSVVTQALAQVPQTPSRTSDRPAERPVERSVSDSTKKPSPSMLERKEQFTPQQIITGDTTRTTDSSGSTTTAPGEYPYSPEQDREFFDAMQIKIPPAVRFVMDLQRFSPTWQALKSGRTMSTLEAIMANMNIPASMFIPDPRERTMYDYGIAQSFTIPGIYEPFRGGGIGSRNVNGVQIPLALIGALLGLVEDVSPTIAYTIEQPSASVEIIVYSVQAIAVAHLYRGTQQEGKYSVTWNMQNDKGIRMPRGYYVGEVKIGESKIVRKSIQIP